MRDWRLEKLVGKAMADALTYWGEFENAPTMKETLLNAVSMEEIR